MNKDEKQVTLKAVLARVNIDELERNILVYWDEAKIFERSLEQTKDKELFSFYDGPPYATGKPHYGHVLQSSVKDAVLRYQTMLGKHVPRRVGWDCHGLPVETLVEKELGIKNKREIEEMGIDKFNEACRQVVFRYIKEFTDTLKRLGRWAEYDKAYATLDKGYMESEWWVFRQLWDQNLVYKAFRSTPYCIRCATPLSNFEVSTNYQDKTDDSVYVLLPVKGQKDLFLLVWTTTPWTLPANVAVAISPDITYVTVENEGKSLVVALDRAKVLFGEDVPVVKQWTAAELQALEYEPLYNFLPAEEGKKIYQVVTGAHVTANDGTGLVHIAPAFGEEDATVGKENNLVILKTVDADGRFIAEVKPWAGKKVFSANSEIIEDLKSRDLLFKQENITHSYPFCWRCDTPLIYYALDTWFINVQELKPRMIENSEQINWTPKHVKHGRFGKGLESAPDWAVSRNRYWSVPVPIWECNGCQKRICIGSLQELSDQSGSDPLSDMHRPMVDEVVWECADCGHGQMKRVPEVLDVWFDAGSMPYASWHYPFENQEQTNTCFPADFIVEMIEQTRLWFYVLTVLATALTSKNAKDEVGLGENKPAFLHAIGSGLIFAEDGRKLSKKLKNYPEIDPTIKNYGADSLRFYLLSSSSLGEPYRFSEKDLRQISRQVYGTFWNVYSFFVQYALIHQWQPAKEAVESGNLLDKWILARLGELEAVVIGKMDEYQVDEAARAFIPFIDDLSNWYVRRSRLRFQRPGSAQEKEEAFGTLYQVLVQVSKLLAPFMPFVSEEMYRNLTGKDSVHLELITATKILAATDKELLVRMAKTRATVSAGLALRAAASLKVRQPLAQLQVQGEDALPAEFVELIKDEVNIKTVAWVSTLDEAEGIKLSGDDQSLRVGLDTRLTDDLKFEGAAREIIRHGQVLRREAGYALNDKITVVVKTQSEFLQQALENQSEVIKIALQATEIKFDVTDEDKGADLKIEGQAVHLGVKKIT